MCEQPPYSILVRAIENDVLPTCQRYGMGVIPWSPLAGGWLSGRYRHGDRACRPRAGRRCSRAATTCRCPSNQRKLEAADALAAAGRGGRDLADRDGARVRDPPPGGDRGDHRAADDGAPRVPAARGRRRALRRACSTGSTRSSRRARTSTRATAAGRTRRWRRRRAGGPRRRSPPPSAHNVRPPVHP